MKALRRIEILKCSFLSSTLQVCVVNAVPRRLCCSKRALVPIAQEVERAPGLVWTSVQKINFLAPTGFEPWTFQTVASRYTDCAVLVTGHQITIKLISSEVKSLVCSLWVFVLNPGIKLPDVYSGGNAFESWIEQCLFDWDFLWFFSILQYKGRMEVKINLHLVQCIKIMVYLCSWNQNVQHGQYQLSHGTLLWTSYIHLLLKLHTNFLMLHLNIILPCSLSSK
jgi:hypothetical protein